MTKQKTILIIIILLLIASNIYFGFKYLNSQRELRSMQSALETQKTNEKVLDFTKLFIEKVLKANDNRDPANKVDCEW